MKAKEIQDLIDFIAKSGLDEVNIETEQFKISVKRSSMTMTKLAEPIAQPTVQVAAPPIFTHSAPTVTSPAATPSSSVAPASDSSGKNDNYYTVKSPMIGTFYRSANPDSPSFVNVGDTVKKGQTLCIIEAMKLFNEIESEVAGRIVKILVDNASPVEYDQPLFLIDPS